MTALSTHDTKRGEDVRARITALAEAPETWSRGPRPAARPGAAPDPGFGNLLWQAIVGAWPAAGLDADWRERLHGYAEKAMREAGDRTTWTAPDEDYEAAVHAAVDAAFDRPERARRRRRGARRRRRGRLEQRPGRQARRASRCRACPTSTRAASCGSRASSTPTTGDRSTTTYAARCSTEVEDGLRPGLAGGVDDPGAAKLLVTRAGLLARREQPDLFDSYAPVEVTGEAADHVLAFDRGGAVTVATRLPAGPRGPRRLGRHDARACPPASGSTRCPGDRSPVTPRWPTCSPTCRWRCCCRAPPRSSGSTTASTCGRRGRTVSCSRSARETTRSAWR